MKIKKKCSVLPAPADGYTGSEEIFLDLRNCVFTGVNNAGHNRCVGAGFLKYIGQMPGVSGTAAPGAVASPWPSST